MFKLLAEDSDVKNGYEKRETEDSDFKNGYEKRETEDSSAR